MVSRTLAAALLAITALAARASPQDEVLVINPSANTEMLDADMHASTQGTGNDLCTVWDLDYDFETRCTQLMTAMDMSKYGVKQGSVPRHVCISACFDKAETGWEGYCHWDNIGKQCYKCDSCDWDDEDEKFAKGTQIISCGCD